MTKLKVEHIVGPCAITLVSSIQVAMFAKKVGTARRMFNVPIPAITGDDNFVRIYRAHQNSVEFYPIFMGGLWTGALMLHQAPVCLFGLVYIVGRQMYFSGYSQSIEKRMPGFKLIIFGIQGLWVCSVLGLAHQGFIAFTGKSLMKYISKLF